MPLTVAVFELARIIGHATPLRAGANGVFALSRTAQARAGSGWVPPTGSHSGVQCSVGCPGPPLTLMSRDTFGGTGLAGAAAPAGAVVLPHAVAAAAQIAAIRKYR